MASSEVSEVAVTVRDFLGGAPRVSDGQLTPQQERNVIIWRLVFSFRRQASMFGVLARLPHLVQSMPPDEVRDMSDQARRALSICNSVLWQQVRPLLEGDPLADVLATAENDLVAQSRRWLESSSTLVGPEPEPPAGVVRHRTVSSGPVGPRITLLWGDEREAYDADEPLLRRALALQAELWLVATTVRAPTGDRLLALRTEAEFESWRAGVVERELDLARLSVEQYEALTEAIEGGSRSARPT